MRKILYGALALSVFLAGTTPISAQRSVVLPRKPPIPLPKRNVTQFQDARAMTDGNGVLVSWEMQQELNNMGFYLYRLDGGERVNIQETIVPGSELLAKGTSLTGQHYALFDPYGSPGSRYEIEALQLNGTRITRQVPMVSFVADLRAAAGQDAEMIKARISANNRVDAAQVVLDPELRNEVNANALAPDSSTQKWVAAQPGVKIGVNHEGFYRVTKAQLQTAGFDVNSDPNLWQLYRDGNQQAIVVAPNGDYIEFYGNGIDTQESDTKVYFLVVGPTAGMRIATVFKHRIGANVIGRNFIQSAVKKERTGYLSNLLNGDAENYFGRLVPSGGTTYTFSLTGVDTSPASCLLTVRLQGFSTTPHSVNLSINGRTLTPATGSGQLSYSASYNLPCSALQEGDNNLSMTAPASGDFSFFDSVSVTYSKKYVADSNQLSFTTPFYRGVTLSGFSSANIRVFDITNDGQPGLVGGLVKQNNGGLFTVSLPPNRPRVYYAVEDSAISSPVSITPNAPSTLSTTNHTADLVIISYKDFITQANAWADYRRGQGFTVEVVNVEDVFDEFNFGTLSAQSMKDFLFYAKNNWQGPPKYVLLIGDGDYDSRNYEGYGFFNYIPAFIVNTVFSETASDDSIVDFNGDGLADIAIGRIPARTTAQVTLAFNKTTSFEQPAMQSLSRGVLLACDVADYDFCGASGRLRDQLPAGTPNTIVSKTDPNAQTTLISQMNAGKYLINYAGHGNQTAWAGTTFFSNSQISQLTNVNNLSIYTMLTCLNGFFHHPTNVSLSEALLLYTNAGAAAAWASSGLTTPDVQEIMGQRFYNQIGLGNMKRLGDLVIDAKSVVPGGTDVRQSWVLIGDPMLQVKQ